MQVDDRELRQALGRLRRQLDDPRPALAEIGNRWLARTQLGFRSGTDPYGRPWAQPIRDGRPLRDSGRLRDSFGYEAERDGLVLGTNVRYARPHQEGATIRARNHPFLVFRVGDRWVRKREVTLPQRKMLPDEEGLPDAWRDDALDALEEHLLG